MASIVQLAGMLPRDPEFRAFVGYYAVPPREVSIDEAAQFIRLVCEVSSRRELATNKEAEKRFHEYLRRPFLAWRERQAEHV